MYSMPTIMLFSVPNVSERGERDRKREDQNIKGQKRRGREGERQRERDSEREIESLYGHLCV